jgi:tetratricopeptide (TPR) repeat protein
MLCGSALVAGLALGMAAGCSNTITFSKSARDDAQHLQENGEYANAAAAYRRVVRIDPTDYKSFYNMGKCYEAIDQRHEAISAYQSALDVMPLTLTGQKDPEFRQVVINSLCNAVNKSDRADSEITGLEQRAKTKSTAENNWLVAKCYGLRGDADMALEYYNKATKLDKTNFYIWKDYGLYLERLNQNNTAEQALRKAYTINDQDEQVQAALRRLGVVPGPSLKDTRALAKPIIPQGPIPEVDWEKLRSGSSQQQQNASTGAPTGSSAQAPRD